MTQEEREEQQMQQAGKIIADLSDQMDAANAATDAAFSEKIKAAAGMVGDVALNIPLSMGNAAKGIGEDYLDSIKGVADYGDRFGLKEPSEEEEESMRRFSLNVSKVDQLAAPVGKTGFHMGAAAPICTANAVVRCSFGATFGQLKVLPINRYCMGPMNAPVATITDFAPIINMPSFMLCFNILNPAVALETALATAAKGGVFTLVPMPCASTMVSTPWKPGHPTMLSGGRPVLTQTCSSSCWGIGTINIIHCGQGLMPNSYNWFMGPDWISTLKGNAELLANAVGSIGALAGMVTKGGKLAQIVANNKALSFMKNYGVDVLEGVGNSLTSFASFMDGNPGDGFASATDAGLNILGALLTKRKGMKRNAAGQNYTDANYSTQSARDNLNTRQMDSFDREIELGNAQRNQTAAQNNLTDARRTQTQANTDLSNAKGAQTHANENLSDAKRNQAKAEQNVTDAKSSQTKANKDLDDARGAQADAETKVNQAKEKQKAAEQDVVAKEQQQTKAREDFDNAKTERDKVYSDPNSTPDQKKTADAALADAEKAKDRADIDLGTARHEKIKADNGVEYAQSRKAEADDAVANAQTNKTRADNAVTNAETNKMKADVDMDSAELNKAKADMDVNNAKANKANADSDVDKAQSEKKQADEQVNAAQKKSDDAKRQVNDAEKDLRRAQREEGDAFDEAVEASTPQKRDSGIVDGYGRDFVLKVEENYAQDAAGSYFEKDWGKYVDYSKEKDDD